MPTFVKLFIDNVLEKEKGYVDHEDDSGGATNHGIIERVAREHGYTGMMEALSIEQAREIYYTIYFKKPKLDFLAEISQPIAEEVFDAGVNIGTARAIMFLQQALSVFNKRETFYKDLVIDGNLGPMSLTSLRIFLRERSVHGEEVLLKALNCYQGEYYLSLAQKYEKNESFVFGWIRTRVALT